MNPFKIKALEDFTIEDCEAYLNRYPYGEHCVEVKNRIKGLKKEVIRVEENTKTYNSARNNSAENKADNGQHSKKRSTKGITNVSQKSDHINKKTHSPQKSVHSEEKNIIDTILWWVGAIVIVIIVGTIIIYLLDLLLPEGTFQYIQKHRWAVYGICLLISKCFDKN